MADGRHFGNRKNRHVSATVWPILMKFGTVSHIGPLQGKNLEVLKIQDGGGCHLENHSP